MVKEERESAQVKLENHFKQRNFSGAPAARRAAKRSPMPIETRQLPMVIVASGIARGRDRTTTTTTLPNN